jgi:hypothetical protein
MLHKNTTEQIGRYVVTPLTQTDASGQFTAAVSIRRGTYDRIFRFIPHFLMSRLPLNMLWLKAGAWCLATS